MVFAKKKWGQKKPWENRGEKEVESPLGGGWGVAAWRRRDLKKLYVIMKGRL